MSEVMELETQIIRNEEVRVDTTSGTPAGAFASFRSEDGRLWRQAIDEMLGWRSTPEQFPPEDRPDQDIIITAIDYACDKVEDGGPVPESIVPSGSGRIAMEWNAGTTTVIVEFIGLGVATLTRFEGQRVVVKTVLYRNPKSRKLEQRG